VVPVRHPGGGHVRQCGIGHREHDVDIVDHQVEDGTRGVVAFDRGALPACGHRKRLRVDEDVPKCADRRVVPFDVTDLDEKIRVIGPR
jgi:hypothetical protein